MSVNRASYQASLALFLCITLFPGDVALSNDGTRPPMRRALLIGCSEYPLASKQCPPLPGAANDVRHFSEVLARDFSFDDITTLSGWDDESKRPTAARIETAFEELIQKVTAGDELFILLSGHGTQVPVPESQTDLLAESNPEPDGFDEMFLAADYHHTENGIRDDQFGVWLTRLRERGAHVWVVFDCCFSGTMTRGTPADDMMTRGLHPREAGIPKNAVDAARKRALDNTSLPAALDVRTSDEPAVAGSLVAFYACQPFETAKEVFRPIDAERVDAHRCGLLSYHILRALKQCQRRLSYRDFSRLVVSGIRADLGSRGPTPLFEGQLDRGLLGFDDWPETNAIYLERIGGKPRLSAGMLAGLSAGSVLSLHPLAMDSNELLGFVEVTAVRAADADVKPAAMKPDATPVSLDDLPDVVRCKPVSQTWTSRRKSISVRRSSTPGGDQILGHLAEQLKTNSPEALQWTDATEAQLLLDYVPSNPKESDLATIAIVPGVILLEHQVRALNAHDTGSDEPENLRQLAFYPCPDLESLGSIVDGITRDVRRIQAWETLWRIADLYGEQSQYVTNQISVHVNRAGPEANLNDDQTCFRVGDHLDVYIVNRAYRPMWYTVFFVNGAYGIEVVKAATIPGRKPIGESQVEQRVERIQINGQSLGIEGYIVLAVPLKANRAQPEFGFLAQAEVGGTAVRKIEPHRGPTSLFEQALLDAAEANGTFRSGVSADDAQVASFSWTTIAPAP